MEVLCGFAVALLQFTEPDATLPECYAVYLDVVSPKGGVKFIRVFRLHLGLVGEPPSRIGNRQSFTDHVP